MGNRESDRCVVPKKMSNVIGGRHLHNIALCNETLSIHRDRRNNENEIAKNSRNVKKRCKD